MNVTDTSYDSLFYVQMPILLFFEFVSILNDFEIIVKNTWIFGIKRTSSGELKLDCSGEVAR